MVPNAAKLDPVFERTLRQVIFDRDLPCPHCSYNLSGIRGTTCPECGNEVGYYMRIADLHPERLPRVRFLRWVRVFVAAALLIVGVVSVVAWVVGWG